MSNKLNTKFYFLSPVEVVKVTPKNLQEVAAWCGGKVARTESRRVKGRIDSYVWVPTPKGSAISWAFPGMFITKRLAVTEKNELKATFSVFRKDYFARNYFDDIRTAVDATWERSYKEHQTAERIKGAIENGTVVINIHQGDGDSVEQILLEAGDIIQAMAEEAGINLEEPAITDETPLSPVEQRQLIVEDSTEAEAAEPHSHPELNKDPHRS